MIYFIIGTAILTMFAFGMLGGIFKGLPVLMYHKVSAREPADNLTITTAQLEEQFHYFNKKGYTTIFLSDLLAHTTHGKTLPHKPLLLTFDDGYQNNYTDLYPLLQKFKLKANIFLIAGFIRNGSEDSDSHTEFLHVDDIGKIHEDIIQFALHTFDHQSYASLSVQQIDEDIKRSKLRLEQLKIPYQPCLAYTYGAYPKNDTTKMNGMFNVLKSNGIELAMRIGNRINKLPLKNKLLIERIDIRGNESFLKFRISLAAGRKIFFK